MSKYKKTIKDIILIIIIAIAISAIILPRKLNNLDELWNFNFAKNISDGKMPYKDFNMVQTPLLPIISGYLLTILGQEVIVTRIIAIILNTLILFVTYKILEQLNINRYFRYLILIFIYAIYHKYLCLDYNYAVLFIILITIFAEIKRFNKTNNIMEYSFKWNFGLGILVGTSILCKQTTGLILSLVYILYIVILIKNKNDLKQVLKITLTRFLGVCIPIILFIIYLYKYEILTDFMDYAIYGIKTFSNKIPYISLIKYYEVSVKILSIILPITLIYTYFKIVIKENKQKDELICTILCAYSVASFVVAFPISDSIHFLIGAFPSIILFLYIVYTKAKKISDEKKTTIKEYTKILVILTTSILLVIWITQLFIYLLNCRQYNNIKHFSFIQFSDENSLKTIGEYILEKEQEGIKVYILDASACVYMIPIDKYNKNYDMFLKGNLGSRGEEGQIEDLKKETNVEVLILKNNYRSNWQNPEKVRSYIINNWIKTGEILHFDIYKPCL